MNDTDTLRVVKVVTHPFSEADPWFRAYDAAGALKGAGETEESARQTAERAIRRERGVSVPADWGHA